MRGELEGRLAAVRAAVSGAGEPRVIALEWLDPPDVGGDGIAEVSLRALLRDPAELDAIRKESSAN